ncbi:hypothetical protein DPMN_108091 [Dreissena polymorpha]|uniref:Uncharacterized protein n=1 Tax=Dreissena polymorpha TaxID=45954 RepID=A0A9D4K837_DREPO|nr:hypothetical protein DPMN_108091 [Dreissena polymorpha]
MSGTCLHRDASHIGNSATQRCPSTSGTTCHIHAINFENNVTRGCNKNQTQRYT